MQAPKKPKIVFLIIASVVSAAIAWGFFMDPIVAAGLGALGLPPPRWDLPEWDFSELLGGGEEQTSPQPDGEETQKSWWEGILDGLLPDVPDVPDVPDEEYVTDPPLDWPQTDPPYEGWVEPADVPPDYYTDEEKLEAYYDTLVQSLSYLAAAEHAGLIAPIEGVGLFDLDVDGTPEIITVRQSDGYAQYTAYEMYAAEELTSWWLESDNYGELVLWKSYSLVGKDAGYSVSTDLNYSSSRLLRLTTLRSVIWYNGYGGDCVSEITRDRLAYRELFYEGDRTNLVFRVDGEAVDEKAYYEAYEAFKQSNEPLTETAMVLFSWTADRPERMAKQLLNSEQQFFKVGK